MTKTLKDLHQEWMQDPEYRAEHEALEPEFQIARELVQARKTAGLSQVQVAERMDTTQSVVSRLESGHQNASIGSLQAYAKATGRKLRIELVLA